MKKSIKIEKSNAAAIVDALVAVNGNAFNHAYTNFKDISDLAKEAEARLELIGIKKAIRTGASFASTSGRSVPKSYSYSRTGTLVVLERKSEAWYLAAIARASIYPSGGSSHMTLTTEQDRHAIEAFRKQYKIKNEGEITAK